MFKRRFKIDYVIHYEYEDAPFYPGQVVTCIAEKGDLVADQTYTVRTCRKVNKTNKKKAAEPEEHMVYFYGLFGGYLSQRFR